MQPATGDASGPPSTPGPPQRLVLGPILRHADTTTATVWVETRDACEVVVRGGGQQWSARTFGVHGHHYALVECADLAPGSTTEYQVELDGETVWPPQEHAAGLRLPAPVLATLPDDRPPLLLFGSCRTSVSHDRRGNLLHGVDALRAFGLSMAGIGSGDRPAQRPDLVLFLGDQVYADETSDAMRDYIAAKRDIDEPPGTELADYDEYAHLYQLAWSDPVNRWLLSTLPSAMIFDDHDIRDDWNTSAQWRREMEATDWWHGRIVSGLASYWVYQHLGNMTGEERAEDEVWRRVADHSGEDELDLTEVLDTLAERVDQQPRDLPVELRAPPGRRAAGRGRLPRRAGAAGRPPLDAGRRRDGMARPAAAGRLHPPAHRHLAALPAARAAAPRRGLQRGAGRGRLGTPRGADRGATPAGRRPGALGSLPAGVQRRGRDGAVGGARRARHPAVDGDLPVRGRAPQLCRPGARARGLLDAAAAGVLADPQPAAPDGALRHGGDGLRLRAPDRSPRGPPGQGARPALPLGPGQGAVVRQQHRHPAGRRRWPADVVVDRRRPRRAPRPPHAARGRRDRGHARRRRCARCDPAGRPRRRGLLAPARLHRIGPGGHGR